jgi:2-methylcitrate dehydratase
VLTRSRCLRTACWTWFTWQDAVDKCDQLVDGRLDNSLSDEIKHAVRSLETIQTRDLTALLARVPYPG